MRGTVEFHLLDVLVRRRGLPDTPYAVHAQCRARWGIALGAYAFTLPEVPGEPHGQPQKASRALGLRAFTLFRQKKMAIFFIFFSMLLGVSLQITNGFANPFITSFRDIPEYAATFGAKPSMPMRSSRCRRRCRRRSVSC